MHTVVYLSDSHNPWFNLAIEDWLFHQAPLDQQILFLWRNQPSVVIGRAQNPWSECHLNNMLRDGVLLARRQSGGGTVFHDLGNTNFTFISPLNHYDKNANLQMVVTALQKLGITAYASPRNDLLIDRHEQPHKISGSAFRQTKDKAFHHGTLLVNANLLQLHDYLQPKPLALVAKGVPSVRSTVLNLTEFNSTLNHEQLCQVLPATFFQHYGHTGTIETLDVMTLCQVESLMQRYQEYQSWEWRFGKTLPFELTLTHPFPWGECALHIHCTDARIDQIELRCAALSNNLITEIQQDLLGKPCYAEVWINTLQPIFLKNALQQPILTDISNWLASAF